MKRHGTDAVSLGFGLIFIGIAGWWLLVPRFVAVRIPNLGWFVAAALIIIGVLGVIGSFRRESGGQPAPGGVSTATGQPAGEQTAELPAPDEPWPGGTDDPSAGNGR